jgi:hypothetical protein
VSLTLQPGKTVGAIVLGIEAGIVRLDDEETIVTGGELHVAIEFEEHTLFAVKPTTVSLHGISSPAGDFGTRANVEVDKLLNAERGVRVELFPTIDGGMWFILAGSTRRIIDSVTVGIFYGDGDPAHVERSIAPGRSVSCALAADYVRTKILCRGLLESSEQDPEWRTGDGPTELERGRLPAPCGTGSLSRERDGVHVRLTQLNFTFRDGYIDVTGTFDADGTCWKVRGGTFDQKLSLGFDSTTGVTVPSLDPAEPNVHYDADVLFLCQALAFLAGVLVPYIGSVVLGVAAVVAIEIAKALVDPAIPAQRQQPRPVPAVEGIDWKSLAIASEGLLLQGEVRAPHFVDAAYQTSSASLSVTSQPVILQEWPEDEVTYQAPMCEARIFRYRYFTQEDVKRVRVESEWLIPPLRVQWFVNGTEIPDAADSPLTFVSTVRTALPPPAGDEVPGHVVELGYDFGPPLLLIGRSRLAVTLRPRASDLRYGVRVTTTVTDAANRTYQAAATVDFAGVVAQFGTDYDEYRSDCFGKVRDLGDHKVQFKHRLAPGEPQEAADRAVNYIRAYIAERSPDTAMVIESAVLLHGVAAINKALAQRRGP